MPRSKRVIGNNCDADASVAKYNYIYDWLGVWTKLAKMGISFIIMRIKVTADSNILITSIVGI